MDGETKTVFIISPTKETKEAMERLERGEYKVRNVHEWLKDMGWTEEDIDNMYREIAKERRQYNQLHIRRKTRRFTPCQNGRTLALARLLTKGV